jgi:hypothetical protein
MNQEKRAISIRAVLAAALVAAWSASVGHAAKPGADNTATSKPTEGFHSGPMLKRFLDGPMKGVDEIVFAERIAGRDHWYVTFGNYADHSDTPRSLGWKFEDGVYWGYAEGGRLCRLNLRTGKLTVLLEDLKGGVRDPQVHYDGKKVLFAYRKGGTHPYHLYEIRVDGAGLRQLTDGPDDDIEPTYCPVPAVCQLLVHPGGEPVPLRRRRAERPHALQQQRSR